MTVQNSTILVVGGTDPACAKLRLSLDAGASVHLVGETVTREIQDLIKSSGIVWIKRDFRPSDLDGKALVFIALGPAEAAPIAELARARNLPVNVIDQPALSSFSMPAIIDRDPVTIAISTQGMAPALARSLRRQIEAILPARLGRLAAFLARWRPRLSRLGRRSSLDQLIEGAAADLVLAGREDAADAIAACLSANAGPSAEASTRTGVIQLVGAGPGDPDLLTLAASRALSLADIVFHDALVPSEILARIRRDAERVDVGKSRGCHPVAQEEIAAAMIRAARAGKRVVRLKGGDPFIFGRGGEEMLAAERAGIPVIVIPGVTAALGCAAAAGIPLTHRGIAGAVTLVTGHRAKDGASVDWAALARSDRTLAIYMGRDEARAIADGLIGARLPPSTPVAVIANGTRADMHVVTGCLGELPQLALEAGPGPSLIIVGEVVRLSAAWNESILLAAE